MQIKYKIYQFFIRWKKIKHACVHVRVSVHYQYTKQYQLVNQVKRSLNEGIKYTYSFYQNSFFYPLPVP